MPPMRDSSMARLSSTFGTIPPRMMPWAKALSRPQPWLGEGHSFIEAHHEVEALNRLPGPALHQVVQCRKTNDAAGTARGRPQRKSDLDIIASRYRNHFRRPIRTNSDEWFIAPALLPES